MVRKQTRGERNIEWCEDNLCIPDGKFVGQPLKLAKFMKDDLKAIYDNPAGTRRAIITRGRKNAKSTECAIILLLHMVGPEHKINGQCFSIAQSRDQAAIIFNLAARMVRTSPEMRAVVTIRQTAKELACAELGTSYKALSAETATAFGLSPALTIVDEAGQIRGARSELYEAMETATAAQEDPLTIIISTQAPSDARFPLDPDRRRQAGPRSPDDFADEHRADWRWMRSRRRRSSWPIRRSANS